MQLLINIELVALLTKFNILLHFLNVTVKLVKY